MTAQHQARKRFTELAKAQSVEKQLDVEWGQLQLEQHLGDPRPNREARHASLWDARTRGRQSTHC